jgi:ABC-type Na+ efflux pump permease subunit
MNSMGLIFGIIGVALLTLSAVTVTVFLVLVLIGIKKAIIEFKGAVKRINSGLNVFDKVSAKVMSIGKKSPSLVISGISFLFYAFSSIRKRKK